VLILQISFLIGLFCKSSLEFIVKVCGFVLFAGLLLLCLQLFHKLSQVCSHASSQSFLFLFRLLLCRRLLIVIFLICIFRRFLVVGLLICIFFRGLLVVGLLICIFFRNFLVVGFFCYGSFFCQLCLNNFFLCCRLFCLFRRSRCILYCFLQFCSHLTGSDAIQKRLLFFSLLAGKAFFLISP